MALLRWKTNHIYSWQAEWTSKTFICLVEILWIMFYDEKHTSKIYWVRVGGGKKLRKQKVIVRQISQCYMFREKFEFQFFTSPSAKKKKYLQLYSINSSMRWASIRENWNTGKISHQTSKSSPPCPFPIYR